MPLTTSAKKALRGSQRKRVFNLRRSRAMRQLVKDARAFVARGKTAEAQAFLPQSYQAIDKAAKRGVIKKKAAARKKARLTKAVNKIPVKA